MATKNNFYKCGPSGIPGCPVQLPRGRESPHTLLRQGEKALYSVKAIYKCMRVYCGALKFAEKGVGLVITISYLTASSREFRTARCSGVAPFTSLEGTPSSQ